MHAHAHAVRTAIERAKRDNAAWLTATKQHASAPTGGHMAGHMDDAVLGSAALPPGIKYHSVSESDILLGLRIGSRLVLIDNQRNKTSELVRAVDGILVQAKRLAQADPGQPLELMTSVDGTDRVMVKLSATPLGGGRMDTELHLLNNGVKTRMEPVGIVEWALL